jgi:purine-binding chemotaxis protein CheW
VSAPSLDQATGPLACLFEVAGQTFAVEINRAREARIVDSYTVVPLAPPHVRGMTNLRGAIIPIVDLRVLLDLPPRGGSAVHVLVVEANGVRVAIAVDHVVGVEALEELPEPAEALVDTEGLEQRRLRRADETIPVLDVVKLVDSLARTKEAGA